MLVGLALAALGSLWIVAGLASFPGAQGWGYDYQAYADAAVRLAQDGSLYQAHTLDGPYRPGPYGLYYYAPPLGIAVGPLAGLDSGVALWYLLHLLALLAACALLPVPGRTRVATFGVAALSLGVTHDLVLGNVSVLLLLPLAVAWRWLDRPAGAVAQALAMSVRPMLGILLIWQLLRRQWRAVAWTVGSGLVIVMLTLPFVGLEGYREYLTVLRNLGGATGVEHNLDLGSTLLAMGVDGRAPELALLAGYGLAIAAVGLSLRRGPELGFVVTSTASLLLSPILWDHHLAMLVLPAAYLAARGQAWGLALPLATWLPPPALPFVVLAATWAPFLAREPDARPQPGAEPKGVPAPDAAV